MEKVIPEDHLQSVALFTPQPLAAWGIVMVMTDGRAAVVRRAALFLFTL